ncbi:hypothetical protein LSH36_266g00071 [Paralvinella palmiformis]|uniref:Ribonuclease H1 n=1 Tax=Paralvinella palmiformis TaxID=53620 RepID=A0AAD9JL87_9ANNE|nr:hypothetical protein LSH36_266g00071 [Paralvinella palmiformis]
MGHASLLLWRGFYCAASDLLTFVTMPKGGGSYYAVRRGRTPGVYMTWDDCLQQTKGFSGARYKKFSTEAEAEAFVTGETCDQSNEFSKTNPEGPSRVTVPSSRAISLAQLKDITQKLVSSVRTVSGHATDGRRVIGQLCIKSSSVPDSTQHVLKKFDSMLLQAQDQLQLLEQLVSKGEFFCRELHSGKRSTPPADVDSNNEDNAAETPRCKKMRLQGITKWIVKWKKNGWKLSNGNSVINRDDIEQLENSMKGIAVKWEHVRGHAGVPGNEEADKLANEGARKPYSDI